MRDAGMADGEGRARHGGKSDQRADLDMIRADPVRASAEPAAAVDGHRVGADAFDPRAERDEEVGEVLHVRLGGGVAQHRDALGAGGGAQGIFRRGDARLVEEDVGAGELLRAEPIMLVDRNGRAELLQREQVRVDAAPSDHVAARRRQHERSAARQHRPGEQDRGARYRAHSSGSRSAARSSRAWIVSSFAPSQVACAPTERIRSTSVSVSRMRGTLRETHRLVGQQRRRDDRQRGVLVAARLDAAGKAVTAFDDVADAFGCLRRRHGRYFPGTGNRTFIPIVIQFAFSARMLRP